jgi:hypothetical protein
MQDFNPNWIKLWKKFKFKVNAFQEELVTADSDVVHIYSTLSLVLVMPYVYVNMIILKGSDDGACTQNY